MFNEILNGSKSIEDKPPADPYRAPAELPPTLVCTSCQQEFPASQALAGRCRSCAPQVDAALAALQGNVKADYTDYATQEADRELSGTVISIVITIVIAIALAVFRYGIYSDEPEYDASDYSDPYTR